MDLDILHIRLTAYALGELDAAQKAEIERILTESQDARDQVARTKNIAKAIRELLPQTADDVQPMTPGEYRVRKSRDLTAVAAPALSPAAPDADAAAAPGASAIQNTPPSARGNGLVGLLAACCVLLAIGWLWQTKSAPPAPKEAPVSAAELESLKTRLAETRTGAAAAKDALEKEAATHAELEQKVALAQKELDGLKDDLDASEAEKKAIESARADLERALARARSAADAFHQPFVPTGAQVVFALSGSGSAGTLDRVAAALKNGQLPLPGAVDAGELVQSCKYNYPAPPPGSKLPLLSAAAAACPWAEGHVLARITVAAGTEAVSLSSLQIEFNPSTVSSWRLIGREAKLEAGGFGGGQGCGELKAGATLTLLCELVPVVDPMAPLQAKRADLALKLAEAKRAKDAASGADALAEAKLTYESLRLDLQDLDAQIARTKVSKAPDWRYSKPADPTAEAASGDWLTVSASVADASGQTTAVRSALGGKATSFPEADADFRLAASAAALGLVLRESPARGKADLALVSTLLKDLPQSSEDVKMLTTLTQQASLVQVAP